MDQAPPASELGGSSALAQNTIVSVQQSSGGTSIPPGLLSMYISATPPSGWLICDGTAISRTTYAALFAVLSTGYGAGDGSTTFNLPDLRGRVPVGQGTHADVASLNANDGQAVANRRPKHRTSLTDGGHTHTTALFVSGAGPGSANVAAGDDAGAPAADGAATTSSNTTGITVGSGNANDALDAPSYIVVSYIIKT